MNFKYMPKAIYPNSRVQNHGFKNKMLTRTSQKTQRGTRDTRSSKLMGEKFGANSLQKKVGQRDYSGSM